MKTLYLIRHAEAEGKQPDMQDFQRTLTLDGIGNLNKLGEYLTTAGIHFDSIITSHAARAFETALCIADQIAFPEKEIITDKRIYSADNDTYLDILYEQPDEINHLAFVGHNPSITGLASYFLVGQSVFLFPANMVAIQFSTDKWAEIRHAERELLFAWPHGKI